MTEERLIEVVNGLLFLAAVLIIEGLIFIRPHRQEYQLPVFEPVLKFEHERKTQPPPIIKQPDILDRLMVEQDNIKIEVVKHTDIETEYLGEYFITAYCPEECGWSWSTSSGATCHYSDDPLEPTTCAIDRNYHGYGEYLMIDDKIYVTEDTGPGVKGRWVDCFVETMDEVRAWNTRWTSVYSVEFVEWEEIVITYE